MKLNILNFFYPTIFLTSFVLSSFYALSQDETGLPERHKARMSLSYSEDFSDHRFINVKVSSRVKKKIVFGANENVELYVDSVGDQNLIAKGKTNESGNVRFPLAGKFASIADSSSSFSFVAALQNSDNFFYKESKLNITEADLQIELYEEDSVAYVKTQLRCKSDISSSSTEDVELKFYIKRYFRLLPFGGDYNYTDQDGIVIAEFPSDIPSDEQGEVEIVVQLVDHKEFGTI